MSCRDTVKPVLSGHLEIDKTKVLMKNGSFMKVVSIAECSAILLTSIKRLLVEISSEVFRQENAVTLN